MKDFVKPKNMKREKMKREKKIKKKGKNNITNHPPVKEHKLSKNVKSSEEN